ncbi:response regulator transcription factor [Nitratifractor salsuginis]|uniref:Two component transcriptional regulator, winged helix family n=1 Tax=Nitratifractor salsuginis (strain DSM 16511 / JCM 12458 / E9I37-1) TaxID=749222 RepID=E6X395_NITSE|nr:response regulator transcription factor [Nitratifractor salsuginis]ADV47308.1 two component transcriptional regulator, winged helix family [Nitratifractor salsuginis DSM 16511]
MERRPLILIIEDEEDILELEEFHLQNAGFETMGFLSSRGVRQALEEEEVALMVVDRNLPGEEGSELIAALRREGFGLPVIFVTAKDRDEDVEEGFRCGGDDYLRKPFNMNELVWRVKALLRRGQASEEEILRHRALKMDLPARRIELEGEELSLTRLEFELLRYFLENPGRVISREELLDEVWDDSGERGEKTVNVAVNRLKKKIERDPEAPTIEAVRGAGYRLC